MRTLKKGMSGEDVRYLQYIFITKYSQSIKIDGDFGPATETAAINVQKILGFTGTDLDGSIGPATQKKMGFSDYKIFFYSKSEYDIWFAGKPYNGNTPNTVKTLKQFAEEEKCDFVHNLTYFVRDNKGIEKDQYGYIKYRVLQDVRGKGKDIGYGGKTQERIVIDNNNYCAGWSLLIKEGIIHSKQGGEITGQNANGILQDGTYFQVQSITTSTEYDMVKWVNDNYNVKLMLRQDGGGSTLTYDAERDVLLAAVGGNRAVATSVCIKKKTPTIQPPVNTFKYSLKLGEFNSKPSAEEAKAVLSLQGYSPIEIIKENI